jgi:hypothetical protein
MSAVPLPRGPRRADRPPPDLDSPMYFTRVPSAVWEDRRLTHIAVRLLGWAVDHLWAHPGQYPTVAQAASGIGVSVATIRRAYRCIEDAGYIVRERIPTGGRFRPQVAYELRGPRPKLSASGRPDPQLPLFAGEERLSPVTTEGITGDASTGRDCALPASPHTPVVLEREREDDERPESSSLSGDSGGEGEPPIEELIDDLVRRSVEAFAYASRSEVEEAVREYGELAVEIALDKCLSMEPRPSTFRYALGMLRNWRKADATVGRPTPKRATPEPRVNHNPGPKYEPVPPEERASLRDWRKFLPPGCHVPPAREKPAAGPLAKVPPPPVPEIPDISAPAQSYREQEFTARGVASPRVAHPAPGGSNPAPPPIGGASPRSDIAPGPAAGGRSGRGDRGDGDPNSRPSPGPPAGARACAPPGVVAVGPAVSALLRRPGVESDPGDGARQRRSGDAPAPHRRE